MPLESCQLKFFFKAGDMTQNDIKEFDKDVNSHQLQTCLREKIFIESYSRRSRIFSRDWIEHQEAVNVKDTL